MLTQHGVGNDCLQALRSLVDDAVYLDESAYTGAANLATYTAKIQVWLDDTNVDGRTTVVWQLLLQAEAKRFNTQLYASQHNNLTAFILFAPIASAPSAQARARA